MNKYILMSDADNFSNEQAINPYYQIETIDYKKAKAEHANIKKLLIDAGVKIKTVISPKDCQDGVYVANWALVRGDIAVLSNLPNARKAEEAYALKILRSLGKKIVQLPEHLKFSGQGDALTCGDLLFCGSGYRSDVEAQKMAAEALGYTQVQLETIPKLDSAGRPVINKASGWSDSFFYDIDLALAIIKVPVGNEKGLIAYCPEAFTPKSQVILEKLDPIEKIKISLEEAKIGFAANLVSTGDIVIMSDQAPIFAEELRRRGFTVFTPDITELAKGGGYIRCITLTLD